MHSVNDILQQKLNKVKLSAKKARPVNPLWEEADEFAKYVGLPTPFVLRLMKQHGRGTVLGLRSWLKDCPYDPQKGFAGLVVWKLKQIAEQKKNVV